MAEYSWAKDVLVVGDDSEVYDQVTDGTCATCDDGLQPSQEDFDFYWDAVYEATGELVRARADAVDLHSEMGDYWFAEGRGVGWRGQRGYNLFEVHTYERATRAIGFDFLNHILPQTDNAFYIYDIENEHGLRIENRNHDAPVNPEVYECLPVEYMISVGMWWGINGDRDQVLEEIHDVLMAEWEFEFLNKELRDPSTEEQLMVLNIEFPGYYRKFLARYNVVPTSENQYKLTQLRGDLGEFFDRYYAERADDEFGRFLEDLLSLKVIKIGDFNLALTDFLTSFDIYRKDVASDDVELLRKIYDEMVK